MKKSKLHEHVIVAVLSAISIVLMLIEFPILPGATFLKLDFSLIIMLLGTLMYGLNNGILIVVLTMILHLILKGFDPFNLVGCLVAFFADLSVIIPMYFLSKKNNKFNFKSVLIATVSLVVVMLLLNKFITFPLYIKIGGLPKSTDINALLLTAVLPFNVLKGIIITSLFNIVYMNLKPWMEINYNL